MEEIDRELIALLCTKAGMLMEDHSTMVLTMGSKTADEQKLALRELPDAAEKIRKLAAAAQSIAE